MVIVVVIMTAKCTDGYREAIGNKLAPLPQATSKTRAGDYAAQLNHASSAVFKEIRSNPGIIRSDTVIGLDHGLFLIAFFHLEFS